MTTKVEWLSFVCRIVSALLFIASIYLIIFGALGLGTNTSQIAASNGEQNTCYVVGVSDNIVSYVYVYNLSSNAPQYINKQTIYDDEEIDLNTLQFVQPLPCWSYTFHDPSSLIVIQQIFNYSVTNICLLTFGLLCFVMGILIGCFSNKLGQILTCTRSEEQTPIVLRA